MPAHPIIVNAACPDCRHPVQFCGALITGGGCFCCDAAIARHHAALAASPTGFVQYVLPAPPAPVEVEIDFPFGEVAR